MDTGIAGDLIARRFPVTARVRDALARGDRVGIAVPALGELLFGVELSNDPERNWARLTRGLAQIRRWPFDVNAAQQYGRVWAALRRAGRPMQQVDVQIAAIALSLGSCTVVTKDSDFTAIPGLKVEDWSV